MIRALLHLPLQIYARLRKKFELRKYDAFNIEDYFRKQGADVGSNNRILINNIGDEPYLIKIGNHCTISTEVALVTHDGGTWVFTDEIAHLQKLGPIKILDNCFIGYRATILPNVTIGPNSIVGACSVVTKDVPPETVVAGNPAKAICSLSEYREKVLNVWNKQKPPGYLDDLKDYAKYSPSVIYQAKMRDKCLLESHLINLYSLNKKID